MEQTRMMDYDPANCAIGAAVEMIGERSTFLVLREAVNGGLLRQVPYQDTGQRSRHEYRLTAKGLDLYPVLVGLMQWGDRYGAGPDGPPVLLRHRDCGQPVRLQLACEAGHVL